MKILTGTQIRELDKYTIEHEPIKSIDLMERAAKALTRAITRVWDDNTSVVVFAGPGNNGGDALAVARMMGEQGYSVKVYLFNVSGTLSADCSANKERLAGAAGVTFIEVTNETLRFGTQQTPKRRFRLAGEIHQPVGMPGG